jgi:serine/threonine protein kinase
VAAFWALLLKCFCCINGVYILVQGVLENGDEIAVKKLSLESRQGVQQFTTEVRLLLRVQHRNLVSLLGCCATSGQKMLVYPYFPNRSLDRFLFGKSAHLPTLSHMNEMIKKMNKISESFTCGTFQLESCGAVIFYSGGR